MTDVHLRLVVRLSGTFHRQASVCDYCKCCLDVHSAFCALNLQRFVVLSTDVEYLNCAGDYNIVASVHHGHVNVREYRLQM